VELQSFEVNRSTSKEKRNFDQIETLRPGYILSEVIFWKKVRNKGFHQIDFEYGKRQNFLESLNLKMCRISDFRIRHDLANVMK